MNQLRLRLKRAGRREKAAKAAALQSFLSDSAGDEMWPMIGLVQAIVQRSLAAGFELHEVSMQVLEAGQADEGDMPLTLMERLAQSDLAQKADSLLRKVPGLTGFLQKQADSIWEEGIDAVFSGELYLGLFTTEELEAGFDIFSTTLGGDLSQEAGSVETTLPVITDEKRKALISRFDDYVTEVFTPGRLDQLRRRLRSMLHSSDYPKKWMGFLMMLAEYMADEDAVEYNKRFFISALLGEIRAKQGEVQEQ